MRSDERAKNLFYDICTNGSMDSYDRLFRLLSAQLIHFSATILGSYQTAEEIVSDVFIMLWQKKDQLLHVQNPGVYLYVCTRNFSLNALPKSKQKSISFDLLDKDALVIVPDMEHRLISGEVAQVIEKAIRQLPGRCQIIFRLVKMDGLSYKEVADLLEISPKTVDAQLAIAIKKLSSTIRLTMPENIARSYFNHE